VHAGWRGALVGIAGKAARELASEAECDTDLLRAYIGPHIGACHYEVGSEIMSQFVNVFGTFARADSGGLDLGSVVAVSLIDAGVDPCNIASLGECTAETTDRFYSYRAEAGLTGRHGALACVL
jgi:copper oxidase (laccase) domain-containing protein